MVSAGSMNEPPTTCPELLMAVAKLEPPPSVPRSRIAVEPVVMKARSLPAPLVENPTIWPASLRPTASALLPPRLPSAFTVVPV